MEKKLAEENINRKLALQTQQLSKKLIETPKYFSNQLFSLKLRDVLLFPVHPFYFATLGVFSIKFSEVQLDFISTCNKLN